MKRHHVVGALTAFLLPGDSLRAARPQSARSRCSAGGRVRSISGPRKSRCCAFQQSLTLALLLGASLVSTASAENWLRDLDRGENRFRAVRYHQPIPDLPLPDEKTGDDLPLPGEPRFPAEDSPLQRTPERREIRSPDVEAESVVPLLSEGDPLDVPFDPELYEFGWPLMYRAPGAEFFAGADYLYVRPTFSEATAFAEIRNPVGNTQQTLVQHEFGYKNHVRAFVGFRRRDCGTEIRFTYTDLGSDTQRQSAAAPTDLTTIFAASPELQTQAGESVLATGRLNANLYDIGFAKTYAFCPDNPCVPCAPWDLTWTFDARIADISWETAAAIVDGGAQRARGETQMSFSGGGPRIGLEGRRYLNPARNFSVFARGWVSLILGHYEFQSRQLEFDTDDTDTNQFGTKRMIPVTEMEVGLALNIRRRTTVTAGYLFQTWHDLGIPSEIAGQFLPVDDANILSFDGLFIRGELTY